jgi:hypothetical protein
MPMVRCPACRAWRPDKMPSCPVCDGRCGHSPLPPPDTAAPSALRLFLSLLLRVVPRIRRIYDSTRTRPT